MNYDHLSIRSFTNCMNICGVYIISSIRCSLTRAGKHYLSANSPMPPGALVRSAGMWMIP